MATKQKNEYQIKVDEIKQVLKSMSFDDVVKLRKNVDTIIRNALKSKISVRRNEIKREIKNQNKKLEEVEKMEKELAPKGIVSVEIPKPKKSKK